MRQDVQFNDRGTLYQVTFACLHSVSNFNKSATLRLFVSGVQWQTLETKLIKGCFISILADYEVQDTAAILSFHSSHSTRKLNSHPPSILAKCTLRPEHSLSCLLNILIYQSLIHHANLVYFT